MKNILEKPSKELVEEYIKENTKLKILINWMCKIFSYVNGKEEHSNLFILSHRMYVQEVRNIIHINLHEKYLIN